MRPKIHPQYHDVTASCACGASYATRSTKKDLRLEVCSNCHPFYTGTQHLVDTAGMIEKFQRKYGKKPMATAASATAAASAAAAAPAPAPAPEPVAAAPAPKKGKGAAAAR